MFRVYHETLLAQDAAFELRSYGPAWAGSYGPAWASWQLVLRLPRAATVVGSLLVLLVARLLACLVAWLFEW